MTLLGDGKRTWNAPSSSAYNPGCSQQHSASFSVPELYKYKATSRLCSHELTINTTGSRSTRSSNVFVSGLYQFTSPSYRHDAIGNSELYGHRIAASLEFGCFKPGGPVDLERQRYRG
jgi:hypothetical protein